MVISDDLFVVYKISWIWQHCLKSKQIISRFNRNLPKQLFSTEQMKRTKVKIWLSSFLKECLKAKSCILLPKLFWPTVRKNCSSDWEKLLKFEAEGREFAKILRSLEQFVRTVKGQKKIWYQNAFLTCSWGFLMSNKLEQL